MAAAAEQGADKAALVQEYILHHVVDAPYWSTPFGKVALPEWLTLHGLMLFIGAGILFFLFGLLYRHKDPVPRGLTNLLEVFVLFIRDNICRPNLGDIDGRKMTPLFCSFFFFILVLNLMGLIPLFSTATGNVNVTGALAAITLGFMIFGTIAKNGFGGFMAAFMPHGVPWPVLILLVPIEIMGLFIKSFALMIRLFATMMAGHIVVFSLIGMVVIFGAYGAPSLLLAVGIYLLELFVCFLQAYIFTLLSAIFIGQMYHPAH